MLYGPDNQPLPIMHELAPGYGRASIMEALGLDFQNPDDVAREKGLAYYDDIARDPHVKSVWGTRIMALVGCAREFHPATDSPPDRQVCDFVQWNFGDYLKQRSLDTIIHQMFRAATKNGYTVQEILWSQHPRGTVIADVKDRDPERFIIKTPTIRTPEVAPGLYKKLSTWDRQGERQPPRKYIVAPFEPEFENPYGTPLFQSLHWYVWFKKNGFKFWVLFLEKFGMPTVVAKIPEGFSDAAELQRVRDVLDSIQQRTNITIPAGFDISLLEAAKSGSSGAGYDLLCDKCDQQISKAILGQTLTTQEGQSSGSYALGQVHEGVRSDILVADGKWIDTILNWQVIPLLVDYNFAVQVYPYIATETQPGADLKLEAEIDEKLVNMGVKLTQQYFYDTYNRPAPQPGEAVVEKAAANPLLGGAGVGALPGPQETFAEKPTPIPSQEGSKGVGSSQEGKKRVPTDTLYETSLKEGTQIWQTLLDPVRAAIKKSKSAQGLKTRLKTLQTDVTPLAEYLQRVLVTAHLLGRDTMRQRIEKTAPADGGAHVGAQGFAPEDFADIGASVTLEPLTMDEAVAFMKAKKVMSSAAFKSLTSAAKRAAFAIAKVEDARVTALVKDELTKALAEGTTFADFQAAVDVLFDNYGVTEVNPHHLETVFRTNIQSAYHQGAHDLIYDADLGDLVEYLQYSAVDDDRTRPAHAAMDGLTLPKDDPFWGKWWPPNGYNCRCDVIPVTKYRAQRENIRASTKIPAYDPDPGFQTAPALPTKADLT